MSTAGLQGDARSAHFVAKSAGQLYLLNILTILGAILAWLIVARDPAVTASSVLTHELRISTAFRA